MSAAAPLRLLRETPVPMAECPSCGARMALSAEGARWAVRSPRDVADRLILQLGSLEREELHVLLLNTKNVVMGEECVYRGNVSSSLVRVSELFTQAVRRCAARILLVHNHPSGDPTPSPDDLNLTAAAIAAGRLLDIEVLDHLIIGAGTFLSLRDRGFRFDRRDERQAPTEADNRGANGTETSRPSSEAPVRESASALALPTRTADGRAGDYPHDRGRA